MIAQLKSVLKYALGIIVLLLIIAGLIWAYQHLLSWEWKLMSWEDSQRFHDRWIDRRNEGPDMGAKDDDYPQPHVLKPCEWDEQDHIRRLFFDPYSSIARVCRHWTSKDGYVSTKGWQTEVVEP